MSAYPTSSIILHVLVFSNLLCWCIPTAHPSSVAQQPFGYVSGHYKSPVLTCQSVLYTLSPNTVIFLFNSIPFCCDPMCFLYSIKSYFKVALFFSQPPIAYSMAKICFLVEFGMCPWFAALLLEIYRGKLLAFPNFVLYILLLKRYIYSVYIQSMQPYCLDMTIVMCFSFDNVFNVFGVKIFVLSIVCMAMIWSL